MRSVVGAPVAEQFVLAIRVDGVADLLVYQLNRALVQFAQRFILPDSTLTLARSGLRPKGFKSPELVRFPDDLDGLRGQRLDDVPFVRTNY